MAQQSSVQEADDRQRTDVGKREETAVEEATDAVRGVGVDVDVDTEWAGLTGEAVVDDVVLRQQRTVGDRDNEPQEPDHNGRVTLSA